MPDVGAEHGSRLSRDAALRGVVLDYLSALLLPWFNQMRADVGIEPEPPRAGPPVTAEQAKAAADEYWALEALRAEQAEAELAEWKAIMEAGAKKPCRQHGPRKPTLAKLFERAKKTGVTSITLPDGTIINFGEAHADAVTPLEQWRAKRRGQS